MCTPLPEVNRVGRQAKTGIGLAVVVVLALLAFWQVSALAGVGVLIVGVLAAVVILRRTADVAPSGRTRRKKDDSFLEASIGGLEVKEPITDSPTLQPWSPPEGLQPWSPPDDLAPEAPAEGDLVDELVEPQELVERPTGSSSWEDAGLAAAIADVDVIAEVERIEAREFGGVDVDEVEVEEVDADPQPSTGLFSVPAPINEDVQSDDEIMAASQATELTVAEDNSELAKLLAKVQARLAAYE